MTDREMQRRLLFRMLSSLRQALTEFSGPCRMAALFAREFADPLIVIDPQGLLSEYRDALKQRYVDDVGWRGSEENFRKRTGLSFSLGSLDQTDLVEVHAHSNAFCYLAIFTERKSNQYISGPVEEWLRAAASFLAWDMRGDQLPVEPASRHAIENYALSAINSFLQGELSRRQFTANFVFKRSPVHAILQTLLSVSQSLEEGQPATGTIVYTDVDSTVRPKIVSPPPSFLLHFATGSEPEATNPKHVLKLLASVSSDPRCFLVADGASILGIGHGKIPPRTISVQFKGGVGELRYEDDLVCAVCQGRFRSAPPEPDLATLRTELERRESREVDHQLKTTSAIVQYSREKRHGCTLVFDFRSPASMPSGQLLAEPAPIAAETVPLMMGMARVDGALHFDASGRLLAFGCLLDGLTCDKEDPTRGARHNSAIRFTHAHRDCVVVVVSEDGPMSVFSRGLNCSRAVSWPEWDRYPWSDAPTLEEWMTQAT